jgi:hypothetical protein
MGRRVLAENVGVVRVGYVLPNKHYILVDMKYIGVDNKRPYVPSFNFMVRSYVEFGFWGFSVSKWGRGCRLCRLNFCCEANGFSGAESGVPAGRRLSRNK